jgi:hypothetical protein
MIGWVDGPDFSPFGQAAPMATALFDIERMAETTPND